MTLRELIEELKYYAEEVLQDDDVPVVVDTGKEKNVEPTVGCTANKVVLIV